MPTTGYERPAQPIVDETWLGRLREDTLEPNVPIIDPHHHLWDIKGFAYRLDDLIADVTSGHNIVATVFVQCGFSYRSEGVEELRPVGETERVASIAVEAKRRKISTDICAGIVGHADLRLGDRVDTVFEAHLSAAQGRFRGIRQIVARSDAVQRHILPPPPPGLLLDADFRRGFARLSSFDLTFDAWLFHTQIPELTDLARTFPDTPIVIDHFGGPLGIGPYRGKRDEVFHAWRNHILELSRCPNVHMKLGGYAMSVSGWDFHLQPLPPSSGELANAWRPYVETCLEAFGAKRCMFESNFPVDKGMCSYPVLWNAYKRLTGSASPDERAALFHDTAASFYRLG
jgi:L-fuconolactonase